MNNKEAIEIIRGFNKLVYTDDLKGMEKSDADKKAIELAIESLEKGVPKKPIVGYLSDYACGSCYNKILSNDKYCGNCGQEIDWR